MKAPKLKLTKAELKELKQLRNDRAEISQTIGLLEFEKQKFIHHFGNNENKLNELKVVLKEKYGSLEINLDNGEVKYIKEAE
jgi:hypothetical protein